MNKFMKVAVIALLALRVAMSGSQAQQLTSVVTTASSITPTSAVLGFVQIATNGVVWTNVVYYSNVQDFGQNTSLWRSQTNIGSQTFGTNSVTVTFPLSLGQTWYYRVSATDSSQVSAVWATNGVATFTTPTSPFSSTVPQSPIVFYYAPTNSGNVLYLPTPSAGTRLYTFIQQPSNNSYAQTWSSLAQFPVGTTTTNLYGTNCTFNFEFVGSISNSTWYMLTSSVITNKP